MLSDDKQKPEKLPFCRSPRKWATKGIKKSQSICIKYCVKLVTGAEEWIYK